MSTVKFYFRNRSFDIASAGDYQYDITYGGRPMHRVRITAEWLQDIGAITDDKERALEVESFWLDRERELVRKNVTRVISDLIKQNKNNNIDMKTTMKSIGDLIKDKGDCPLPLEVIPNSMGINLCSVDAISWQRQADGQLTNVTIHFIPAERTKRPAGRIKLTHNKKDNGKGR